MGWCIFSGQVGFSILDGKLHTPEKMWTFGSTTEV